MSGSKVPVSSRLELGPDAEPGPSFHERVLDNLYDGVYFVDKERRIVYWNQGAERLTGYAAAEAVGRHCFDNFLMHVNEEGCPLCLEGCPLAATIGDGRHREAEIYLRHKLGHRVPVGVRVAPITDQAGRILGAVEIFSDISAKKKAERRAGELETLAFRDALTGVPNRRYAELKVKQALEEVQQFGRSIGVLMIDVDHFKAVNDTCGHVTGDLVLQAISRTLTRSLRPADVVGRWGGEEFLVLLMDVKYGDLGFVADKCRKLIGETAVSDGHEQVYITVSAGATLIDPADSCHSLVKRADRLLYQSKSSGRNCVTVG